ncbi:uncharacterized protein LOC143235084 [Tachypleus tridentatus]|uniref:uncharacterized protein LOC143235084 n=1 Tax=Tachypleus tridentatus TaxID=6853 RepID=UPI003FD014E4
MASRRCKHSLDVFCYVCDQFIETKAKKYSVTAPAKICEAYKTHFGMLVRDQDKPWTSHFTWEYWKKNLEGESTQNGCNIKEFNTRISKIFRGDRNIRFGGLLGSLECLILSCR